MKSLGRRSARTVRSPSILKWIWGTNGFIVRRLITNLTRESFFGTGNTREITPGPLGRCCSSGELHPKLREHGSRFASGLEMSDKKEGNLLDLSRVGVTTNRELGPPPLACRPNGPSGANDELRDGVERERERREPTGLAVALARAPAVLPAAQCQTPGLSPEDEELRNDLPPRPPRLGGPPRAGLRAPRPPPPPS
jgi:hypothetical protein